MVYIVIVLNYQITLKRLRLGENVYRIINKKTGKAEGDYITWKMKIHTDEQPLV